MKRLSKFTSKVKLGKLNTRQTDSLKNNGSDSHGDRPPNSSAVVTQPGVENESFLNEGYTNASNLDGEIRLGVQLNESERKCWAKSIDRLKYEEPEAYAKLEMTEGSFDHTLLESLDRRIDKFEKEKVNGSQWFARLQRSLPALASVKDVTMGIAKADSHQLASYIYAGIFCAVELALNVVSAENQLLIMEITPEISIILQKWLLKERPINTLLEATETRSLVEELLGELPNLYFECLRLYCSILSYLDGTRLKRTTNKISQVHSKWKTSFEKVKRLNKKCDPPGIGLKPS